MKTIKITEFALTVPTSADYNHNSEFKQSFGNNPNLRVVTFSTPNDAFRLSHRYWKLYSPGTDYFEEFNKIFKDIFQTIVLLDSKPLQEIELTYVSNDDRIRELLNEIEVYEGKIKNVRREIESLTFQKL